VIRYRYSMQVSPPAPFVYVTLQNPLTGAEMPNVPALLDSAADQTLIPDAFAQALGLTQLSIVTISGVGGIPQAMPSYAALLGIHNLPRQNLEVVGNPKETYVLLGRDVLNNHRIVLDGPQLSLEIG
jgi:hypothetical protein